MPKGPATKRYICRICEHTIDIGEIICWGKSAARHDVCPYPRSNYLSTEEEIIEDNTAMTYETEEEPKANGGLADTLAEAILPYIENRLNAAVSVDQLSKEVYKAMEPLRQDVDAYLGSANKTLNELREQIAKQCVTVIIENRKNGTTIDIGLAHKDFQKLLNMVRAGVPVWLCGPAGSGKTHAAGEVAKALGLAFYFNGAIDTEYKLSGFVDAQGRIVSTAFRNAYTNGGIYLFDEVDASYPSAVLAFNAALSNGHCDFPGADGPIVKHPDFHPIAAANTWGLGADFQYVGRAKMDAAFLDRFVYLHWDYDEALESALATDKEWAKRVQALRKKATDRGLQIVISPRATLLGCKLIEGGFSHDEVLEATIKSKLKAEHIAALGV